MAILVELSGEVPELARQEAVSTLSTLAGREVRAVSHEGPVLVLEDEGVEGAELARRLGLAHHVSDGAVSGELSSAPDLASTIDIGDAGSFRVRVRRTDLAPDSIANARLEAEVGARIRERTGAQVDLVTPEAEVRLVLTGRAYAGLLGGSVDRKGLEARAVKHRPFSHPISLHPKYARAMVNLARVPLGGRIMDPFCGTGGMLIETALLGYEPIGSDVDPRMVEGSQRNLEKLELSAMLRVSDVADADQGLDRPPEAIVTDPPYGRSTSLHGGDEEGVLERLYSMANSLLRPEGRLVICLPDKGLLPPEGGGFRTLSVHPMKVHRSLTRHVCVLIREI